MTSSDILPLFGGGGVLVALFVWGLRMLMTTWSRQATEQTKSSAEGNLVEKLTKHIDLLDARVTTLDQLVHRQAIKLTKIQMLLLRMKGCMEDAGVSMPADLRTDLDEFTK